MFAEERSDAMALIGYSSSMASGTSLGGSSKRYSREGIVGIVPSNILVINLLTLSL